MKKNWRFYQLTLIYDQDKEETYQIDVVEDLGIKNKKAWVKLKAKDRRKKLRDAAKRFSQFVSQPLAFNPYGVVKAFRIEP